MTSKEVISQILASQKESLLARDGGLKREALQTLPDLDAYAMIVSGIRRCGKSTLLYQLLKERYAGALYLNFEDPRLYEFEIKDFARLDALIKETGSRTLLFDEIQIIPGWEIYVRQKLDEGFKLVITGSNASLLGRELGTKLTGRHITTELFPFSFGEFNAINQLQPSPDSLRRYLVTGGFPEYVKQGVPEILNHIFEDILIRDIAVRYGVRDVKTLQRLALYLVSNVGMPVAANRLRSMFEVGSTNTITEHLAHLEDCYLFHFVSKFSHSLRKQLVNPRKVYAIDTGIVQVNSNSFTDDDGRKLENLVFLHLRRKYPDIYYFTGKGECDFVASSKNKVRELVQVCFDLNEDTLDRELNGLMEAMELLSEKQGTIVTMNQQDQYEKEGKRVNVIPAWEYLTTGHSPKPPQPHSSPG
jgi:hypothetical protein